MSIRTFTWLLCVCGHKGAIIESENDQPYSMNAIRLNTKGAQEAPFFAPAKSELNYRMH